MEAKSLDVQPPSRKSFFESNGIEGRMWTIVLKSNISIDIKVYQLFEIN
jgi:hypothetical protein